MAVLVFLSNEQVEADECSVARKQYYSALPEHPCGWVIVVVTLTVTLEAIIMITATLLDKAHLQLPQQRYLSHQDDTASH